MKTGAFLSTTMSTRLGFEQYWKKDSWEKPCEFIGWKLGNISVFFSPLSLRSFLVNIIPSRGRARFGQVAIKDNYTCVVTIRRQAYSVRVCIFPSAAPYSASYTRPTTSGMVLFKAYILQSLSDYRMHRLTVGTTVCSEVIIELHVQGMRQRNRHVV